MLRLYKVYSCIILSGGKLKTGSGKMPKRYYARKRKSRLVAHKKFYIIIGSLAIVLAIGIILIALALNGQPGNSKAPRDSVAAASPKNTKQ